MSGPTRKTRPEPITSGFTRRLWRTAFVAFGAYLAISFSVAHRMDRLRTEEVLKTQAHLCAAAITPGPNGDLSESVARLRERFQGLVAVGALDLVGNLRAVFPARPAHRQAVLAVMGHPDRAGAATRMRSPDDGGELAVRGVVVPLNGCPDWTSQRALMLLDQSGMDVYLFRLTAVFSLLACGSGLTGLWLMRRWFDRRVASPLRGLADGLKRGEKSLERVRPPGLTRWHETAAVSEQVEGLLGALAEREARIEQMEFETERQMREKEAGFTQQLRRAKDRAKIDPLTGLGNRGYLCEKIDLVFKQQAEAGEDLAAVMLDVDNFKPYNDTYGHQAGDGVLKFVGALLRGGLRPTDHAIRYGGDEFLLLLPDTGAQSAKVTVERLLKLFRQYTSRLNHSHKLSLSAGVASVVDDRATSGQALIAKADEALYAAKRHGKDKVERHTSSDPLPGYAIETG